MGFTEIFHAVGYRQKFNPRKNDTGIPLVLFRWIFFTVETFTYLPTVVRAERCLRNKRPRLFHANIVAAYNPAC